MYLKKIIRFVFIEPISTVKFFVNCLYYSTRMSILPLWGLCFFLLNHFRQIFFLECTGYSFSTVSTAESKCSYNISLIVFQVNTDFICMMENRHVSCSLLSKIAIHLLHMDFSQIIVCSIHSYHEQPFWKCYLLHQLKRVYEFSS